MCKVQFKKKKYKKHILLNLVDTIEISESMILEFSKNCNLHNIFFSYFFTFFIVSRHKKFTVIFWSVGNLFKICLFRSQTEYIYRF